jgi:hypothetical protein
VLARAYPRISLVFQFNKQYTNQRIVMMSLHCIIDPGGAASKISWLIKLFKYYPGIPVPAKNEE